PSHVYKLKKALYGLKQAPRAWYDDLSKFLLQNHFFKGTINLMMFIRRFQDDILVVQVYVDDIIFGSTHPRPNIVHATCLCTRYQAKPTEKHLKEVKRIFRYLWGTVNTGLWYTKDSGFELTGFSDADYAGSVNGVTTSLQLSQNSRPPMLDHQDKFMMKAQVHVSKSFAISNVQPLPQMKHYSQIHQAVKHMLRGRLLASFQDLEHEGGDTRSQGGIKDNDVKI
nr:copia protein [Tanacetum cinerariifolium]